MVYVGVKDAVGVWDGIAVKVGVCEGIIVGDGVLVMAEVDVGVKVGVEVASSGGWRAGPFGSSPICSPFHDSNASKYMVPVVPVGVSSNPMKA